MSDHVKKILIADYLPSLNKGELEIISGMIRTFKVIGQTDVSIFSFYPELDAERYPAPFRLIDIGKDLHVKRFLTHSHNSRLLSSFLVAIQHLLFILLYKFIGKKTLDVMSSSIWHEYSSSDALIICLNEDDCVNGPGSFIRYSPVYISCLGKAIGKPVVIYANSTTKTGNIVWVVWRLNSRRLWKTLANFVLNNCDLITVRDQDTYVYYRSFLRNKAKLHLTGDPGILMASADSKTVQKIMANEKIVRNSGLLIGVAITKRLLSHMFSECSSESERYEKAVNEFAKVLDSLIVKYNSNIIFVPHVIGPSIYNDDRVVGRDIVEQMTNKSKVKVITTEYTAQGLKGLLGKFDFFIGDRVHALISSLSANVPCCALAYRSDKRPFNLIGKDFEQEKWIFEVDSFDSEKLLELIADLVLSLQKIRSSLPCKIKAAKEKALINGLLLKGLLDSTIKDC
jgi:colanic acid/amylovoran biosynthesis protein